MSRRKPIPEDDLRENLPLFTARARATDPETSHDAALRMTESGAAGKHARLILDALRSIGASTGTEIAKAVGLTQVQVMRRMAELRESGLVRDTQTRRDRQTVWAVKGTR